MHIFKINVLIQFTVSSACSENHVFIIGKTVRTSSSFYGMFSCIYVSSLAGEKQCSVIY